MRIVEFAKALARLVNMKSWGPFTDASNESKFDFSFTISWSQGAEDLALVKLFENLPQGRYIDVGAHHPSRFSVTRKLYQRGWSGVNIEANPKLMSEFMIKRPKDVNLNFAVGLNKLYSLAVFEEAALSTISPEWEQKFVDEKNVLSGHIQVPGITLTEIQNLYGHGQSFDLLTIDAEGSDLEVIKSFDFENIDSRLYPKFVMIETPPGLSNVLAMPIAGFLTLNGYELWMVLPMSSIFKFVS